MRAEEQVVIDVEDAGDRGPEPRHDEGEPLDQPDIVTEHAHAPRLVARAHQARAERGAREPPDAEQGDDEDDEREIIEAGCVAEVETERHRPRRVPDAVVAAGEVVGPIGDAPDDLAERERDHDEAEAGRAQRQQPEKRRRRGRHRDREDRRRQVVVTRGDGEDAGVAGNAEVTGVTERDHAAIAEHHVDRQRKQRIDQHLSRHVDVEFVADDQRQGQERQRADGEGDDGAQRHICTRPNNPCGRNTSTSTIGRKSTK